MLAGSSEACSSFVPVTSHFLDLLASIGPESLNNSMIESPGGSESHPLRQPIEPLKPPEPLRERLASHIQTAKSQITSILAPGWSWNPRGAPRFARVADYNAAPAEISSKL